MQVLYNFFIFLFKIGLSIFSIFNKKASLIYNGRKSTFNKINKFTQHKEKVIWFHCSSLGEFEQGKPLIKLIRKNYPTHKIAVSFFSSSGFEIVKNSTLADLFFYLPLDSASNAKLLIKKLNPAILILIKYDFWYNILSQLYKNNIPVVLVSAIFRKNQFYFSFYGKLFLNKLKKINHFFVQNQETSTLLNKFGINQTTISGDTRFDTVKQFKENKKSLPFLDAFCQNNKTIVVGSSWENDEKIWIKYINEELTNDLKVIIAPHEINQQKINTLKSKLNKKIISFSELDLNNLPTLKLQNSNILILDTVGLLTKVYAYATIAYVGGGLNKGGVHNVLEPAAYGIPVIYGNNYKKYQEATDLIASGGGISINNFDELKRILNLFLTNQIKSKEIGKNASFFIDSAPNSAQIILEKLPIFINTSLK